MSMIHFLNSYDEKAKMKNYKNYKVSSGKFNGTSSAYKCFTSNDFVSTASIHVSQLDAIEYIRKRYDKLGEYYGIDDDLAGKYDLSCPYVPIKNNTKTYGSYSTSNDSDIFASVSTLVSKLVSYIKTINYTEKKEKLIAWVKSDWNKGK